MTDEDWSPEPAHTWIAGAACAGVGPDPFFPGTREHPHRANTARRICASIGYR